MNIAVNTRLLIKNRLDGIGWFTYESLKRITTQHPEHRFYFIFDREYDPSFLFFRQHHSGGTLPPGTSSAVILYLV